MKTQEDKELEQEDEEDDIVDAGAIDDREGNELPDKCRHRLVL